MKLNFENSGLCPVEVLNLEENIKYDDENLVFLCFRPGQGHKTALFVFPLNNYAVRNDQEIRLSQIRYVMHIAELRLE